MEYEKKLSKIQKLYEEVNCSDDEKSDEMVFPPVVAVKKIFYKRICTFQTLTIACQTENSLERRSQNLVHGLEKIKQHGGGKMHLSSMGVTTLLILLNLSKD